MAPEKVAEKPAKSSATNVTLVAQLDGAKEVIVTGDFTQWSEKGISLTKGPNREWRTTLRLVPGEHQYRLRVDGQWQDHAQAQKRVPNPFGSENCVITVV